MLAEADPRNGHSPRARRASSAVGIPPGGILFGIASPNLPALEFHWPSWLTPLGGPWKTSSRSHPHLNARRSD